MAFGGTNRRWIILSGWIRSSPGFAVEEKTVSIFFDIEKAYDEAWRYGIMPDIHEAGLRWKLLLFINQILHQCLLMIFRSPTRTEASTTCKVSYRRQSITSNWTNNNGFTFSTSKIVMMQFYKTRAPLLQLKIYLDKLIPEMSTVKFLGLAWDPKLTWIPHKQTNNNNLLQKDGATKNCIYKD